MDEMDRIFQAADHRWARQKAAMLLDMRLHSKFPHLKRAEPEPSPEPAKPAYEAPAYDYTYIQQANQSTMDLLMMAGCFW